MKKMLMVLVAGLMMGAVQATWTPENGAGKVLPAYPTPSLYQFASQAQSACIYNLGSNTLYAQINITTNQFAANVASNEAVPIPPNMGYIFTPTRPVVSICWQTAAGTQTVYIAAQQ